MSGNGDFPHEQIVKSVVVEIGEARFRNSDGAGVDSFGRKTVGFCCAWNVSGEFFLDADDGVNVFWGVTGVYNFYGVICGGEWE